MLLPEVEKLTPPFDVPVGRPPTTETLLDCCQLINPVKPGFPPET